MSRKYFCRVDSNQAEIVAVIRAMGGSVMHMHQLGGGKPDIAVGYGGLTVLCEIKAGNKKLTPDEKEFHDTWTGGVYLIRCNDDAVGVMTMLRKWLSILRQ